MHLGLALVAELSGFLEDFLSLGSNFLEWNTNCWVFLTSLPKVG